MLWVLWTARTAAHEIRLQQKLLNVWQNVPINLRGRPEHRRIIRPKGSNSDANGLAFNSIRKINHTKRKREKRKQPALKHMRTVDNFVIIFYFLDHFRFYLFESVLVFFSFIFLKKIFFVWFVLGVDVHLHITQRLTPFFSPPHPFLALSLMDFLCLLPYAYFTACLYDFC